VKAEQYTMEWLVGHQRNKEGVKKTPWIDKNEKTIYQNLWDIAKAALRETFMAMSTFSKNTERSQISNLIVHMKLLQKQE
jgi:hypothetical protein